jgi:hypothetical protein
MRGVAVLLVVALAGCVFLRSGDPMRFYTLASMAESSGRPATGLAVGLGPVTLPGYLDRPSIAIRVDPNRVEYAEGSRWAEPLHAQVARTLAIDLGALLGTDRVVAFPWYPDAKLDVVVRVDVRRFETNPAGTAYLDATWTVRDVRSGVARSRRTESTYPAESAGMEGAVAALSRALADLAREVAGVVETR